jgi:O-antigen/teichoic acid export membrane protein
MIRNEIDINKKTTIIGSAPDSGHIDSFNKRYFFKLSSNFLGLVIGIATQMIIPRGLGPKAYGDFNFITNFFTQAVSFLDMGTSTCFYRNISRRPDESQLISFYACFVALIATLTLGFVWLVYFLEMHTTIWPGQGMVYIYLAAGWGILSWIVQILVGVADAYGITIPAEKARILQRVISLIFIALLFIYNQLYLPQFFFYHYCILIFLIALLIVIIGRKIHLIKEKLFLSKEWIRKYLKEFFNYSHPIFVISLVSLIEGIFDRWLLQYCGGSIQQGFYSLSYQIGAVCFLFTGAMTPLLMREYSILHNTKDMAEIVRLFKRYIPALYTLAAFFSCFLMVQAEDVVKIVGGSAFQGSIMAVAIMSLYPIHQTYGQLTSLLFYATGQTKLYRNIAVIFSLLSLPFTYFMIAPIDKFGLNAGATGLAIKMVVINIIGVNVQLYFNTKLLHLIYWHYLARQISCFVIFIGFAALSSYSVRYFLQNYRIYAFILSGVIYTGMVLITTYLKPEVLGLIKGDVQLIFQHAFNRVNTKNS